MKAPRREHRLATKKSNANRNRLGAQFAINLQDLQPVEELIDDLILVDQQHSHRNSTRLTDDLTNQSAALEERLKARSSRRNNRGHNSSKSLSVIW